MTKLTHKATGTFSNMLGHNHEDTLSSMNNLGAAYHAAGNLDKALPLFEEVLKFEKVKYGSNHSGRLDTLNNLAVIYTGLGNYDKALPLLEETLKLFPPVSRWTTDLELLYHWLLPTPWQQVLLPAQPKTWL